MRKLICLLILMMMAVGIASAETVHLKSGKKIKGEIIEETNDYIRIDFCGVPLTYYFNEIEYVQSDIQPRQNLKSSDTEVIYPDAETPILQKNFLWKVRLDTNTVYILGSIHLAKKDLYPLDKTIEEAFNTSDILVLEVNIDETNTLASLMGLAQAGMYPSGETLEKHLSIETFKLAKKKLEDIGIDINQMSMYKPWFLAMNLMMLELQKLGFGPNYGIDNYFLKKVGGNKKILELETVEYQINLFNNLTDKVQDLLLFSTLIDLDIIEKEVNRLVELWKRGDAGNMELILRKGLRKYPEIYPFYEEVLYKRNKDMALKIEKFLETKNNYFIVVGAAHLVGKEGVIQILKEKGYSIQQL